LDKLNPGDGFTERFITVLSSDLLRVFTPEHPRPESARIDNKAVMEALGFQGIVKSYQFSGEPSNSL
jgi:hypothetical protein